MRTRLINPVESERKEQGFINAPMRNTAGGCLANATPTSHARAAEYRSIFNPSNSASWRTQGCGRLSIQGLGEFGPRHFAMHLPRTPGSRTRRLARAFRLNGRTRKRTVGAEHATVTLLRSQLRAAAGAHIEELARVGRHCFRLRGRAVRTGDTGFWDHAFPNQISKSRAGRSAQLLPTDLR